MLLSETGNGLAERDTWFSRIEPEFHVIVAPALCVAADDTQTAGHAQMYNHVAPACIEEQVLCPPPY